jgi:transposase
MANRLEMANIQAILQLHALQWSQRRIARRLGVDRATVAKTIRSAQAAPKPAIAPSGSEGAKPATCAPSPGPGLSATAQAEAPSGESTHPLDPKPAIAPSGSDVGIRITTDTAGPEQDAAASCTAAIPAGRSSACEPFREFILARLQQELSAQRIYQDLVAEHGYAGSYYSVRRFVQKLESRLPLPMRRLECPAGFEAQVDYGTGASVMTPEGKRRKTHVLRVVLSHSRKGYSEASLRQTTEAFLVALENAFWKFGGVPQTIVIDNLKAAVKHPDWYDPELQPKLRTFCEHYGTTILPTRPYTPRHKGKVERGVDYVQENGLKGKTFASLDEQNRHLEVWEATVADTRIHGTTRQHVGQVFAASERPALHPLPAERFEFFHESQRIVSRDGHVEVAKAYYSVPPEYLRRSVWVRWDARLVRVFNDRLEQITLHVRHEPGRFSTHGAHIAPEKISGVERGARWLMLKVGLIGPATTAWSEAMLTSRGIEGTRVLMGLLALTKKHSSDRLENACRTALSHGEFRLRALRALIARQPELIQATLPFLDKHALIRPLEDYARVVAAAAARKAESELPSGATSPGEATVRFTRQGRANECAPEKQHDQQHSQPCGQQQNPGDQDRRGLRDIHPPGSGSPSSGCSPAGPDSVSPDNSSLRSLLPPLPGESSDE